MIINNGTHRLPHFWPLTSVKNPRSYQIVTQSPIFTTLSKFLEIFTQRPQIGWNLRKICPNVPYFYGFCHWTTGPIPYFCLAYTCFRGMLHPQTQKLENFVFLKQNRVIWSILLGANLIKVVKTKLHFSRLNWLNCPLWKNFSGGQGVIHRPPPWSNTEGDISYNHPLYDSAHLGSLHKYQVYVRLCERRHSKCKAHCRACWRARENFEI